MKLNIDLGEEKWKTDYIERRHWIAHSGIPATTNLKLDL